MKNQTFQWDTMTMGVCYYPEHWPKELWADESVRADVGGRRTLRTVAYAWSTVGAV